jgi:hypothetical protein
MRLLSGIKATWTRAVAVSVCLLALLAYSAFAPASSYASGSCVCKFANLNYSEGACNGGQRCVCSYNETGCTICRWTDDPQCS